MNWNWKKIIPSKFHKNSGLLQYKFLVMNPWHKPFNYILTSRNTVKKIKNSAYCEVIFYNRRYHLLIPNSHDPNLFQALLLLGKAFFTGDRVHRYLNVYKAYECISTKPDSVLKSIRDGLSHPSSVLNNKITKQNLLAIFGETMIDINKFKHQRIFFTYLGKLLVENDKLLYNRIKTEFNRCIKLKSDEQVLHYWQVAEKLKKS